MSAPRAHASGSLRYDVIAIATSAGGLEALRAVLDALPADLPAAVLVMQHLGRYGSALVDLLAPETALPVTWVTDGVLLTPGRVYVCPPQRAVEVRADRTCTVRDGVRRAMDWPIDTLFRTLADAVGIRAIGVVLTGMGCDGAAGAQALARVGAVVLAQSEASARYPSMPRAAVATGAVDLVLPLDEIGAVLAHVAAGGALPPSPAEVAASAALFTGLGATLVGPVLADVDWPATSLGPVTGWPAALCGAVRLVLASHVPMSVYWGADLVQIYNDASLRLRGGRAERGRLGRPAREVRSRAGRAALATCTRVARTGETVLTEHVVYTPHTRPDARSGPPHEAYGTSSCSAILDAAAAHGVGGVFDIVTDTTAGVLRARRDRTLAGLSAAFAARRVADDGNASPPGTMYAAAECAAAVLGQNPHDVPFALVYLVDDARECAHLAAAAGLIDDDAPPRTVALAGVDLSPFGTAVVRAGTATVPVPLDGLVGERTAVLIVGVNASHADDATYREFLDRVAVEIAGDLRGLHMTDTVACAAAITSRSTAR